MKIRILSLTRNIIPYVRELQPLAQTVAGCILMQQLDYWFERKPSGFYKFLEVPEKGHSLYRAGDSWCEELGISRDEFRTAFDRIGIRYKSKSEHDAAAPDRFKDMYYCSYVDRRSNLTWYYRNHVLLDAKLLELLVPTSQFPVNRDSQFPVNRDSQFPVNRDSQFPVNRDSQFPVNRDSQFPVNRDSHSMEVGVPDLREVWKAPVPNTETTQISPITTHTDGVCAVGVDKKSCDDLYVEGRLVASRSDYKARIQARVANDQVTEDQAWADLREELIGLMAKDRASKVNQPRRNARTWDQAGDDLKFDGKLIANRSDFKDQIQARVANDQVTEDQAWAEIQAELIGLIEKDVAARAKKGARNAGASKVNQLGRNARTWHKAN